MHTKTQEIIGFVKRYWVVIILIAIGILVLKSVFLSRKSSQTNVQPLSTRGLPPPETDVPVVLPPDPGEAGKLTLEGIDSNNDGVRDDLEREIVYMYPQNEEVRGVLRAMVKLQQKFIVTEGEHEYFKDLRIKENTLWNCHNYLVFGTGPRDYTNTGVLSVMVINTRERTNKYEEHQKTALPYVAEVGSVTACEKVQGKY